MPASPPLQSELLKLADHPLWRQKKDGHLYEQERGHGFQMGWVCPSHLAGGSCARCSSLQDEPRTACFGSALL